MDAEYILKNSTICADTRTHTDDSRDKQNMFRKQLNRTTKFRTLKFTCHGLVLFFTVNVFGVNKT